MISVCKRVGIYKRSSVKCKQTTKYKYISYCTLIKELKSNRYTHVFVNRCNFTLGLCLYLRLRVIIVEDWMFTKNKFYYYFNGSVYGINFITG